MGRMGILAEFSTMHSDLSAKRAVISHAKLPNELAPVIVTPEREPKRRKTGDDQGNGGGGREDTRKRNPNTWHQTLRAKLGPALEKAKFPTFTAIMRYCGTNPDSVITKQDKRCTPNAFFGRCFLGDKCPKDHSIVSDAEALKILALTKKFQENPTGIRQG